MGKDDSPLVIYLFNYAMSGTIRYLKCIWPVGEGVESQTVELSASTAHASHPTPWTKTYGHLNCSCFTPNSLHKILWSFKLLMLHTQLLNKNLNCSWFTPNSLHKKIMVISTAHGSHPTPCTKSLWSRSLLCTCSLCILVVLKYAFRKTFLSIYTNSCNFVNKSWKLYKFEFCNFI